MQIIIGGAYNGKRKYVEQLVEGQQITWNHGLLPTNFEQQQTVVISGLEQVFTDSLMLEDELVQAEQVFNQILKYQAQSNSFYIILEDIGRGIVPIDAAQRKLRDVLGRLYQLLMEEADTVTRIWYGIPQQLK